MKYLSLILFITLSLQAALYQTNGPSGGSLVSYAATETALYGMSNRGTVYSYVDGIWTHLPPSPNYRGLISFQGDVFSYGYAGVSRWDLELNDWTPLMLPEDIRYAAVSQDRFFVMSSDSVYHSEDAQAWTTTFDSLSSVVELFGDTLTQHLLYPENILQSDSTYILACTGQMSMTQKGIYVSHDGGNNWFEPSGIQEFSQTLELLQVDDLIYMSTTTGVYYSADQGSSWSVLDAGLPQGQHYVSSLVHQAGQVFALLNSDQHIYSLQDTTWVVLSEVAGAYTLKPLGEDALLVTDYQTINRLDLATGNLTDISSGLIASTSWVLALDDDVALSYTGSRQPYLTTDGGNTWELFDHTVVRAVEMNGALVISNESGVSSSSDQGQTFVLRNSGLPSGYLPSINSFQVDSNTLYVAFNRTRPRTHLTPVWEAGGIYKSVNQGQSWNAASNGLPQEGSVRTPIYGFCAHADMLVARTIAGTYRSLNGGSTWSLFETGFAEYESPSQYIGFEDKIIVSTYYGVKFMTAGSSGWESLSDGLADLSTGYGMRFVVEDDQLYLHDNSGKMFYVLEEDHWTPTASPTTDQVEYSNFSRGGTTLYASVLDGGIWKGSIQTAAGTAPEAILPKLATLEQNYPNPFNPSTTINYRLSQTSPVKLTVFDVRGQLVATLQDDVRSAGHYAAEWQGMDERGNPVSTGVYFARLEAGNINQTIKMLFLR